MAWRLAILRFQTDPFCETIPDSVHKRTAFGPFIGLSLSLLNWYMIQHLSFILQGLYSLSGKTSYRKIWWSLEAARFGFKLFQSLWNLAGTSAAMLPRCLSNFRAIRPLQHPISWLRDFTRFGGKTSYRLVNRGPDRKHVVRPFFKF